MKCYIRVKFKYKYREGADMPSKDCALTLNLENSKISRDLSLY